MSSSNPPATPRTPPQNQPNGESWKGLLNDSGFMKMQIDWKNAMIIQTVQDNIIGTLRANPSASRSRSYSRGSQPTPSPKKLKVEDASGDIANANNDLIAKAAPTSWALPSDWKEDKDEKAAKSIYEVWREMLAPPTEMQDSQGSASCASTVTESQSSSYNKDDAKLKFKIGKTHAEKLEFLEFRREGLDKVKKEAPRYCEDWEVIKQKGKDTKQEFDPLEQQFENCLTQPFVNDMIHAALPHLQAYADPLPQHATKLQYYCETKHRYQLNLVRKPDGLLYVAGEDGDNEPKLTKEAQQIGALISIECKSTLKEQKKRMTALRELERDAAEKTKLENFLQPETMHGVMTDGVVWQFHEFQWKVENRTTNLIRDTSRDLLLTHDLKEIADWLVFVLKRSLEPCHRLAFKISIPLGEATLMQIRRPHGERPRFFKAMQNGQNVAIKFCDFDRNLSDELQQKMANRLIKEREYLEELRGIASIVSLASSVNGNGSASLLFKRYVLCMEDAGTALDDLIVSGEAGKYLASIVYRDIWNDALPALESKDLCHNDIHPGNICFCMEKKCAKLVDLESITTIAGSLDDSPIYLRDSAPSNANHSWDKASATAILRCLWRDGSFRKLKDYITEYKDDSKAVEKFIEELAGRFT